MTACGHILCNCESAPLGEIPLLSIESFNATIVDQVNNGSRIASLFAVPSNDKMRLYAVLAQDNTGELHLLAAEVTQTYPALTPACTQADRFEREIAEQFGIVPQGHPSLKPLRFHHSYRSGHDAWNRADDSEILPSVTDFYQVQGCEIHEVAVGPVHAGVIEPGHFRFQCNGENVLHLEISLGFQHRGVERALISGPDKRTIHYMETAAGDTTIGHATAYCQAIESLCGTNVPIRAQVLRGIALELERLANHTGDLGALAGDIGYLPTASFCGRIRGDFLNLTAMFCGNRFGRGIVRPGGVNVDLTHDQIDDLRKRLDAAYKDVSNAANLLWTTPSILNRFEDTGVLSPDQCSELGLVGVAARACGIDCDTRYNFASGIFQFSQVSVSTWHTGDVFARAYVRWLEIQHSVEFIRSQLENMPAGDIHVPVSELPPGKIAISLVEGWRGELCHVVMTDDHGRFARYKIVDSSFHNWPGLAMAMRNQQISDFPVCNKSFNLSYCGHDL